MASGLTVVVFVFKMSELEFDFCRQGRVSAVSPRRTLLRDFSLAILAFAETTVCQVVWTPFPKFQY